MSSTPENPNPPDQAQPIDNDAQPVDGGTSPAEQSPGDAGAGGDESERPLIIP